MRIVNQSKNTLLAQNTAVAGNPLQRMKGLLGRKTLLSKEALLISPCNAVHTFFMRFPIDILFVDKNNQVLKAIISLKPFRFSPLVLGARLVIELPSGTITSTSTTAGDKLIFC